MNFMELALYKCYYYYYYYYHYYYHYYPFKSGEVSEDFTFAVAGLHLHS